MAKKSKTRCYMSLSEAVALSTNKWLGSNAGYA